MGAQDQRPRFYEGQYLAAEDLAAIVDYLRAADARHALGAHAWGIAAGLTLVERPAPGPQGRREVVLQPGVAWDGLGRALVVSRPMRVPESLFTSIPYSPIDDEPGASGQPPSGRGVRLWLTATETATRPPARGFENCEPADQNVRVIEGVQFVIGDFGNDAGRHGPVQIGTDNVMPRDALRHFDASAGEIHDESVPHQTFPGDGRPPRWLVPIGFVRWVAGDGEPGYFVEIDRVPGDRLVECARAFRRYVGVVAERVLGADGNVVIASRFASPRARHRFACLLNGPLGADALGDLAWVEGRLRVLGDVKLAGSKLQLRDADGQHQQVPIYVARHGDVTAAPPKGCCDETVGAAAATAAPSTPPASPRELRLAIGALGQNGHRLVVGPEAPADASAKDPTPSLAPRFVVTSGADASDAEGRAGVNTFAPKAALEVKGDWGEEDGALRLSGAQPALRFEGGGVWLAQAADSPAQSLRIAYRTGDKRWADVGVWTSTQRLGLGTLTPRNRLGIRGQQPDTTDTAARVRYDELASFEDREGTTAWHVNLVRDGAARGLNFAQTGVDDGRLFLQAGGRVGVGTTAPTNTLHVNGAEGLRQRYMYLSGDAGWSSLSYNAHHDAANMSWQYPDATRASVTVEMDDERGARPRFEVYSRPPGGPSWRSHFRIHGGDAATEVIAMARAGGRVGIGVDAPEQKLHVAGRFVLIDGAGERAYLGGDGIGGNVQIGSMNNAIDIVELYNTAGARLMKLAAGHIDASSLRLPNPLALDLLSDATLKHDVAPIADALARVTRLQPVTYRWRADRPRRRGDTAPTAEAPEAGFLAQQVATVFPDLVRESGGGASVAYLGMIPYLAAALSELKAEVDALRSEVAALRAATSAARKDLTPNLPPTGPEAARAEPGSSPRKASLRVRKSTPR